MSFLTFFKLLERDRRIPEGVEVPPARIQLGPVSGRSAAKLRLEEVPRTPSPELDEERLRELTQP